MIRDTYVMRNGQLVPKRKAQPLSEPEKRIHVISDTMPPLKHMATGRVHDSKAAFRADTRAMGCDEIGTDPAALRTQRIEPDKHEIANDVKRALAELRSR